MFGLPGGGWGKSIARRIPSAAVCSKDVSSKTSALVSTNDVIQLQVPRCPLKRAGVPTLKLELWKLSVLGTLKGPVAPFRGPSLPRYLNEPYKFPACAPSI